MHMSLEERKRIYRTGVIVLCLIFFVIGIFYSGVDFFADVVWFRTVGHLDTFIRRFFARLYLGAPILLVLFVLFSAYLIRSYKQGVKLFGFLIDSREEKNTRKFILFLSFFLALIFSNGISAGNWKKMLEFLHSVPFGVSDPVFHHDIGFYIFKLPFLTELFSFALNMVIIVGFVSFFGIFWLGLTHSSQWERTEDDGIRTLFPKTGNMVLKDKMMEFLQLKGRRFVAVFFLAFAIKNVLGQYNLLYSPRGAVFGAGYTDVAVTLWVYRISAVLSTLIALFFLFKKKNFKKAIALMLSIVILVNLSGKIIEEAVQSIVVSPNELTKERPYIEYAIEYTNRAYNLDKIEVREFDLEEDLDAKKINDNKETVQNVSLNDYRPTKEAFNQLQGLRGYYSFHDVDIDRYELGGNLTQVFLSVREMDKTRLENKAQNWINSKLKYTHGYGMAMAPVNKLTSSGQPQMIMKNVPVHSQYEQLKLEKPQVYFGELTNDYVIVNTKESEFDYPKGESNEMTKYDGRGGISLGFWNRLLFSIKERDFKLLISGNINTESKILVHRNVLQRVEKIAPFLEFDEDIYPVVHKGRIYYIVDGYTASSNYPYSDTFSRLKEGEGAARPLGKVKHVNYARNSFKVVVDTYDGTVDFYLVDEKDPMVRTYAEIFPKLFKPMTEMPEEIKAHLRYPQTLFDIQSQVYATYHMKDPQVFYNREDKWDIPMEEYSGETRMMESIYSTYRIPKEERAEFLLSIPYTPKFKQNLTGLLIARNDGENYGKLLLYKMPKDKIVIGPQQMEGKFNNNDKISKDLSLWNSRGSEVLRGHILTVPIDNSLLYIEPLYIRAAGENAIPEVKRILIGYKDKIVMEETLDKALKAIFDEDAEGQEISLPEEVREAEVQTPPQSSDEVISSALRAYEEAQAALQEGSLAEYQKKVDEMGELLKSLEYR